MRQVKEIPPPDYTALRDPWLGELLNGNLYELTPEDWKPRYKTSRSAASAIHAAGVKRGIKTTIAVRGDTLYVQAKNGTTPVKTNPAAKKAPAKKAPAKRAPAKATTKL
jgi:hypothetical protein